MKEIKMVFLVTAAILAAVNLVGCSSEEDAPEVVTCYFNEAQEQVTELPSGEEIVIRNGKAYYEGDIVLSDIQLKNLSDYGTLFEEQSLDENENRNLIPITNLPRYTSTRNVGVYPTGYNLWAMVRFTYDSNLSATQKQRIKTALLRIQSNTNVRFYNATGQPTHDDTYNIDYPYVNFTYIGAEDTSSSSVGRIGGKQDICLADFAFYSSNTHVIEHEICHALGLLHEQCRPDRDSYVTINTSNLTAKGKSNFTKRTKNYTTRGSYDFSSVMGYSSLTSSTSMVIDTSQPMYTKKDGSYIYQGTKLSDGDRSWINYYYLPYVARSDTYAELDSVVYDGNNQRLSETQRLQLQAQLNNGNATPPANGRITNDF